MSSPETPRITGRGKDVLPKRTCLNSRPSLLGCRRICGGLSRLWRAVIHFLGPKWNMNEICPLTISFMFF